MAFQISTIGGFGTGTLDAADDINAGNINSYARITAITPSAITIDTATAIHGSYEDFTAGTEILFHVSAAAVTNDFEYLGSWKIAKILQVDGTQLYLDTDLTQTLPPDEFGKYYCQAVSVAHFKNIQLNEGVNLTPITYSASAFIGGILAVKCAGTLTFNGGNINLAGRGIPIASKNLRPLFEQEKSGGGYLDTDTYSAWENGVTKTNFLLNAGDGAAFIVAKKIVGNADSRIGNPSAAGEHFKRAKTYAYLRGGSTLFIACEDFDNFTPAMLSKTYSVLGQGLGRCFLATNTRLKNDEALYSHETLSDPTRPMRLLNVRNFGDGSLGNGTDTNVQQNNYARVTSVSGDGKVLTYTDKTTAGLAQITRGALVMVHANHKSSTQGVADSGRFVLAKVLADTGTELTLDTAAPNVGDCNLQIISIPQYNNFALNAANTSTPKYDGAKGGLFAVAVKNYCNLTGGKVNVEGKGGGQPYGAAGLEYISNANLYDRLPIGEGHGSVFILSKELTMDASTRIGATYAGDKFGGGDYGDKTQSGYVGKTAYKTGGAGSGAGGGKGNSNGTGGYGSNGKTYRDAVGLQGAHVMIIAETINGFNQAAISTGGGGGTLKPNYKGVDGGAGYGGGGGGSQGSSGGYNGGGGGSANAGGGGSSGWAYIYTN